MESYIKQRTEYLLKEIEKIRDENDLLQKTIMEMASRLLQIKEDKKIADLVHDLLKDWSRTNE
ncbi:hypothetical protein ApAK_03630 [Thermoplasmatales archaeon AK]|nr:hypothetical protein [Thermoplasmatales archaeon AK]